MVAWGLKSNLQLEQLLLGEHHCNMILYIVLIPYLKGKVVLCYLLYEPTLGFLISESRCSNPGIGIIDPGIPTGNIIELYSFLNLTICTQNLQVLQSQLS